MYRDMVRQSAQHEVALTRFWDQVQQVLNGSKNNPLRQVSEAFQQRWETILSINTTQQRVAYACEALEVAVQEAFEVPEPGWRYARYHSPDVMIAAKNVEAIRRGEYALVLGEFHMGVNTLNCALFLAQNPCPTALLANIESDFPQLRLIPIVSKSDAAGTSGRFLRVLVSPKDYRLELAAEPSIPPTAGDTHRPSDRGRKRWSAPAANAGWRIRDGTRGRHRRFGGHWGDQSIQDAFRQTAYTPRADR